MLPEGKRAPLRATLPETPERRVNRLQPPACPACHREETRVTVRTSVVLYLRCSLCGHIWNVPRHREKRDAEPDSPNARA
jgi:formate dehydrogenase maturation protein FdhE